MGIEVDNEKDFDNAIYKIYTEGVIDDSDYRFTGLYSIKADSSFYISWKYWGQDLDQLSSQIERGDDLDVDEMEVQEYIRWEESEDSLGKAYFLLGCIGYEKEQWDEAIFHFEQAISHRFESAELYSRLGWAHRKQNNIDSSIEAYEKATQLDDSQSPAFYMLGLLKAHKGQSDEALEAYSKTVELNPENADAFMRRGDLYIKKGKLENAKSDFEKCNSIDDTKAYSFYRLGLVNKELKEFEESASNLSEALDLNENMQKDDGIWSAKGWCEFKSKQYDKAVKSYSKALKLNKKAAYHYWRGNSYLKKGSNSFAIEDLKLSIKLNKSNKFSFYKLGVAYKQKGETESALEALNKAVEIDPDFKAAKLEIEKTQ